MIQSGNWKGARDPVRELERGSGPVSIDTGLNSTRTGTGTGIPVGSLCISLLMRRGDAEMKSVICDDRRS